MSSPVKFGIRMLNEIDVLEQHGRTTQLVIANLVAGRTRLMDLPADAKRERLVALQDQAIDAARKAFEFSEAGLTHLREIQDSYTGLVLDPLPDKG